MKPVCRVAVTDAITSQNKTVPKAKKKVMRLDKEDYKCQYGYCLQLLNNYSLYVFK